VNNRVQIILIISFSLVAIVGLTLLYLSSNDDDTLSRDYETLFHDCIDDYDDGRRSLNECNSILNEWEREIEREIDAVLDGDR